MRKIIKCNKVDYPSLTDLWERSVRATHDFLTDDAIAAIREDMLSKYLPNAGIYAIKDNRRVCGFIGVSDNKIEMLFVDSDKLRQGYGSALLDFAMMRGYRRVDVNEQNEGALAFYLSKGFRVIGRDDTDAEGRDYPVLHLSL